MCAGNLVS